MKLVHMFLVALMAFSLNASDANPVLSKWKALVSDAKKSIKSVSPDTLMKMIKDEEDFILVDVREPNEVSSGWIENLDLKKIPRGLLDPKVAFAGILKPDDKIVIYCKSGARGALATKMLQDLGFKDVSNLKGGIIAWMKAEYPIVTVNGAFKSVPYKLTGCGED